MPQHIYLSGFMGSGKSTVARFVAQALNRPWVDTDQFIEKKWKMTVSEIFSRHGEAFFRNEERMALKTIARGRPSVVSVGGGLVLHAANREVLRQGTWINLKVGPVTVIKRLQHDASRPLLSGKGKAGEISNLLRQRRPFYDLAPHQIETDSLAAEAVGKKILQIVQPI